jgi:aspartate aminotransferase
MEWPSFKPSRNLERLELPGVVHFGPEVQRPRSVGEDILDLASEEPGFATPRSVLDSGVKALHQRKTSAVAGLGILDLRAAAARHLSLLSGGRPVNADNILVSCSEQQAMFNAKPVSVQGDVEWSLKVGVSELEVAANAQTKGLLLSSPVNPTGAVYTHSELQAILGWATERRLWVICDELYRRVHFGSAPAPSVLDLPDELLQQAIVVTGTGPAYGMTGFGVGLTLAPRPVTDWMCILQRHAAGSAAHPAQWAAATALADERVEPELDEIFRGLRARRDRVVQHFRTHLPGVEFVDPLGGFYFFFRVDGFFGSNVASSSDFCRHLLDEGGVALVPGAAFGDDRWVRLSYSRPDAILEDALPRISYFATDLVNR